MYNLQNHIIPLTDYTQQIGDVERWDDNGSWSPMTLADGQVIRNRSRFLQKWPKDVEKSQ
jgi:hypothetical protein